MARYSLATRRRIAIAIVCIVAVVGAFVVRLIDIQVVRADQLVADSLAKTGTSSTIHALRGDIVDTNGTVLASSVTLFDITVSPRDVSAITRIADDGSEVKVPVDELLAEIAAITGQTAEELRTIIDSALGENPDSNFAYLTKSVDYDTYRRLVELDIWWLYPQQTSGRVYPLGAVAGNVVGYVGTDQHGLEGVELSENDCLTGVDGTQAYQQSKDGVALPGTTVVTEPAKPGGTLELTIDSDLNWYLQQLVSAQVEKTGAQWGTVIVTEVKTGKIRAIAESSAADPNAPGAERQGSKAFEYPFEPGSIFKPLTAAMLIDQGVADPSTHVLAEYRYNPSNGASIKDAVPHDPYQLTLSGVLQQSSNTGLSILGEQLSAETRYDYLADLGFGKTSGLNFPGEEPGVLHPWQEWDNQTWYTTMFGQAVQTSALQIASAYQALGNNGVQLPLQLTEGCTYPDGTTTGVPEESDGNRVFSEAAADQTVGMMETVVTDGFLSEDLEIPGYRVAAKSGTGEIWEDGKLKSTYFSSMAGLVPAEDPEYAITVHLNQPQTHRTSESAAPVFQQAVLQVAKKYGIPPSTEPAPDYPGWY
ncbi:penicillin-binding protein 2 [Okibacterium endophyticum]